MPHMVICYSCIRGISSASVYEITLRSVLCKHRPAIIALLSLPPLTHYTPIFLIPLLTKANGRRGANRLAGKDRNGINLNNVCLERLKLKKTTTKNPERSVSKFSLLLRVWRRPQGRELHGLRECQSCQNMLDFL